MSAPATSRYDRVARIYDHLACFYSGGAIARTKLTHLAYLRPGDTVLYAGVGTGNECVAAAARGALVTAIDSSQAMVAQLKERFDAAQLPAVIKNADVRLLNSRFDVVFAPFFLNVFSSQDVGAMWRHLSGLVTPGGYLISADFSRPSHFLLFRLFQKLYYLPPLFLFRFIANNPWHELYDYRRIADDAGTPLKFVTAVPTRVLGLPLFETLVWKAP